MRTWMKFAPAILLLLPFTLSASGADETTAQKIEKLQTDVDALRREVKTLQADVLNNGLRGARIEEEMSKIRELLQKLDRLASAQESTRYYRPPEGVPAAVAPTTGMITVRNQYTADATIRLNGRPWRVPAGRDVRIGDVPLGSINYDVEVDGYGLVQPLRTETLRPNGRIITIFPQFGG
ncbi:MAG TPA: hypothetical protein VH682_21220 [Gemmataceae bacterium]|jgi:outer membrane murein-binding lipoprotein Lpp